jgi:hypothetical protein
MSSRMSQDFDLSSSRETLRQQIAEDHGFALYEHYAERDAAAFLRLHPVTLKKVRLAGSIGYIPKGRRAIAYFGFQIADYLIGLPQTTNTSIHLPSVDHHPATGIQQAAHNRFGRISVAHAGHGIDPRPIAAGAALLHDCGW